MTYEYIDVSSSPNGRPLIELINEKALQGFRVVSFTTSDSGYEQAIMERGSEVSFSEEKRI